MYSLIGPPDKTTRAKGSDERDTVDELCRGAGFAEFVQPPVDVEEGGGEFVEDEVEAVVI